MHTDGRNRLLNWPFLQLLDLRHLDLRLGNLYGISSCITYRPLSIYMIFCWNQKSNFWRDRTDTENGFIRSSWRSQDCTTTSRSVYRHSLVSNSFRCGQFSIKLIADRQMTDQPWDKPLGAEAAAWTEQDRAELAEQLGTAQTILSTSQDLSTVNQSSTLMDRQMTIGLTNDGRHFSQPMLSVDKEDIGIYYYIVKLMIGLDWAVFYAPANTV